MEKIKFILFDCMETLIDFTELPGEREYALWSYYGSGVENRWQGFEDFFSIFLEMRQVFHQAIPMHKEYTIIERYEMMVRKYFSARNSKISQEEIIKITQKLCNNFWQNYVQRCFVRAEVENLLKNLKNKVGIGIVSNFIVPGGLEELLISNNIRQYFDFVINSAEIGWRKPHRNIYEKALKQAEVKANEIIFIGDDIKNDYYAPKEFGFSALLYDRKDNYTEIKERILAIKEIEKRLEL